MVIVPLRSPESDFGGLEMAVTWDQEDSNPFADFLEMNERFSGKFGVVTYLELLQDDTYLYTFWNLWAD
jgi:hypothetical protein